MNVRPHPGLLPQEKEKRPPVFGGADATDCRAVFFANKKEPALTRGAYKFSRDAQNFSLSPGERARERAGVKTIFASALFFLIAFVSPLRAQDTITNVMSPVVSYQYYDSFGEDTNATVVSPIVSYQFYDALEHAGTNSLVISPIASYQYFDWLGYGAQQSLDSLKVSYYWPPNLPGPNIAVHGRVVDLSGQPVIGATVSAYTKNILNASVQTDFSGNYTLPPLAPSVYNFTASKSLVADSKRDVALGSTTAHQEFLLLQITPQFQLQTVVAASTPLVHPVDGKLLVFNGTSFVDDLSLLKKNQLTVVITHGFNASAMDWPVDMASALKTTGVWPLVNVVAWNWPVTAKPLGFAQGKTPDEGLLLGKTLYAENALGSSYQMPLDFVGHSLGTLVNRYAIDYLEGHANANVAGASPPWDYRKTHVTLLDEAEVASILSLNPFDWKSPIPSSYAWIDNYISIAGQYHAEAVNVYLQKAPVNPVDAHSYAHWWYTNSVQKVTFFSKLGFRQTFAYNFFLGDSASLFPLPYYPAGAKYQQTHNSDNILDLELVPDSNFIVGNPTAPQYIVSGSVAPGWSQGQVTLQSGQYTGINPDQGFEFTVQGAANGSLQTLDLVNLPAIQATLQTGPPLNVVNHLQGGRANGTTPNDANDTVSNSPAYLWLPIFVPSDVKAMAFDFTISGDGNDDSLAFGINDTNLFSFESRFIADDTVSTSPLIDISAYAGQTNIFFFGIMGGTSTNCTVQIAGVRFYTFAPPQLAITKTGNGILLTWPTATDGYVLETTTNLADTNSWTTLTNVSVIVDSQNTVTNSISDGARFYRLKK